VASTPSDQNLTGFKGSAVAGVKMRVMKAAAVGKKNKFTLLLPRFFSINLLYTENN
jgi:hypothetical protein